MRDILVLMKAGLVVMDEDPAGALRIDVASGWTS
jgi:hypothetical protein